MISWSPSAFTTVAGVVGRPIDHSLSPLLHNAWLRGAGLDAVYLAFSSSDQQFPRFIEGLRGGVIRGLNVTLPFKGIAIGLADDVGPKAAAAGAANLLLFQPDGRITADNTDGDGLLFAFRRQSPEIDFHNLTVLLLGAGGAARGAAATLQAAGVGELRIVNRTQDRSRALAAAIPQSTVWRLDQFAAAAAGADVIINTTSAEVGGGGLDIDFTTAAPRAVAMDMLYRPLKTQFLLGAERAGLKVVDGLDMLIGQAIPSFHRLFGSLPPDTVNARLLALETLERDG